MAGCKVTQYSHRLGPRGVSSWRGTGLETARSLIAVTTGATAHTSKSVSDGVPVASCFQALEVSSALGI